MQKRWELVSIPHRHSKNNSSKKEFKMLMSVSIPHRHSKNEAYLTTDELTHEMFQFLIGTLKTSRFGTGFSEGKKVSIPYRHSKNWHFAMKHQPKNLVSIPYRHSKNCFLHMLPDIGKHYVSIPYRHSKNKRCREVSFRQNEFQFLIGTLKTKGSYPCRCLLWWEFQFLIGTLKTILSFVI